jgi:VanZ family protein
LISKKLYRGLFVIAALAILILSLMSKPPAIVEFRWFDKIAHLSAYLILGAFAFLSQKSERRHKILIAVIGCSLYGGLIELLQQFTSRQPELWDIVVNFVGSLFGAFAALALSHHIPVLAGRAGTKNRNVEKGRLPG